MTERKERPIIFSAAMVRAILDGRKFQTRRILKVQPEEGTTLGFFIPQPNDSGSVAHFHHVDAEGIHTKDLTVKCPFGVPGDRLRVKEAYRFLARYDEDKPSDVVINNGHEHVLYEADQAITGQMQEHFAFGKKRSSLFMPSDISRITLEVTEVRVQRLQDISEEDCVAEGCESLDRPIWIGRQKIKGGGYVNVSCFAETAPDDWLDVRQNGTTGRTAKVCYSEIWESINGPGSWNANPFVWPISFERLRGEQ